MATVSTTSDADLKSRVDKLREERNARQMARLQLLKNLHLQKVPRESLFLNIQTNVDTKPILPNINLSTKGNKETNGFSKNQTNVAKTGSDSNKTFTKMNSKPLSSTKRQTDIKPNARPNSETLLTAKRQTLHSANVGVKPISDPLLAKKRQTLNNAKFNATSLATKKQTNDMVKADIKPNSGPSLATKRQTIHNAKPEIKPNSEVTLAKKRQTLHVVKPDTKIGSEPSLAAKRQTLHYTKPDTKLSSESSLAAKRQTLHNAKPDPKSNKALFVSKRQTIHPTKSDVNKPASVSKRQTLHNAKPIPLPKPNPTGNVSNKMNPKLPTNGRRQTLGAHHHTKASNNNGPVSNSKFEERKELRRSLSTVHFKRMGDEATQRCFKRTFSSGHIRFREIEEELPADFPPKNYQLTVGSEKKKSVTFFSPMRPVSHAIANTPKPSELRRRLNDWLQKRGKSLSTYHHLKCFGLKSSEVVDGKSTIPEHRNEDEDDDDNKENVDVLDDNDSFHENMTGMVVDNAIKAKNEGCDVLKEITPKPYKHLDPLVSEALYDLNQLVLEDYSWLQCAEWLRAIVREYGENIKNIPAYWECRAALEEKRGDFVRTLDCFQNALRQGAQPTSIEESLDGLLQKFMKLNLDPNSHNRCDRSLSSNQKLVDAKNVFKSSLIRFAIKQQDIDEEECLESTKKKYTATPVRRSSRISTKIDNTRQPIHQFTPKKNVESIQEEKEANKTNAVNASAKKPRQHLVQLCESLRNIDDDIKQTLIFVPNKALNFNDCL